MKRILLLILPLLLLAGLVFWLQRPGGETQELTQNGADSGPIQANGSDDNLVGIATDAEKQARTSLADTAPTPSDSGAPVLAPGENWLEGRVEWPTGQGWEESLQVYVVASQLTRGDLDEELIGEETDAGPEEDAVGAQLEEVFSQTDQDPILAQTRVEPDGRFRVALPTWRRSMHVQLLGRHLYLEHPAPIPAPPWDSELVLKPQTGVWIHGRLQAPADMVWEGRSALVRLYREISPLNALVPGGGPPVGSYLTRSDQEGQFELRGVPVDEHASLQIWPKQGAPLLRELEAFVPGGTIELNILIEKGRSVAGRVVDPAGNPVEGAQIASFSQAPLAQARGAYRRAYSDEQGRFTLLALPESPLVIRARHAAWISSDKYRVDGRKDVKDLVVTLKKGGHLGGSVLLPDGSPAVGVSVLATLDGLHVEGMEGIAMVEHMGSRSMSLTDNEGRFRLEGLADLPYQLGAKTDWQGKEVRAFLDNQRPQETEVTLQLLPSLSLEGTVVDSKGEPVPSFTLLVREARTAPMVTVYTNERLQRFEGTAGQFQLQDLVKGHWQIQVQGEDFLLDPPYEVDLPLPQNAPPLVLKVTPAWTIRGRVVDPDGRGVAGAHVEVQGQGLEAVQKFLRSPLTPMGITGPDGDFKMGPMPNQAVSLIASADDWCDSEAVAVELVEGQEAPQVTLALRLGGSLIVQVYGADGEVSPSRMISISNPETPGISENKIGDAQGQTEFQHLAEGRYNVVALGDASQMMRDLDAGTLDQAKIFQNMKMTNAEVLDGKETRVSLGTPPANPITIHGRVTRGGQPVTNGFVSFSANGKSLLDALALAEVKADGHYETTLDGAGRYRVTVQITGGNFMEQTTTEFVRDIAQAEEVELDLPLPEGSISGVVLDSHGQPAGRVRLSVQASGPTPTSTMLGGSFVERQTGDDGTFEVNGLEEGTYTVYAGGSVPYGLGSSEGPVSGRVASAPIRLRNNQSVEGLRLRLEAPGSIRCRITDEAGAPVEGASIFVRDSEGRPLEAFSLVTTQATGVSLYKGLAPGNYTVSARSADLASAESAPITIKAGETTEVALIARSGTTLRLLFKDSEGEPAPASLQVLNDQGLDMVRMFGATDMALLYTQEPFLESERRIGPLPPGAYRVIAIIHGETVEKSLRLRGQETKRLTLRAR